MEDPFAHPVLKQLTLSRSDMEALAGKPHTVVECELVRVDLSGLDLSQWSFEKCDLREADFHGAKLERSTWRSCRAAFASFAGCDLSEARSEEHTSELQSLMRNSYAVFC